MPHTYLVQVNEYSVEIYSNMPHYSKNFERLVYFYSGDSSFILEGMSKHSADVARL